MQDVVQKPHKSYFAKSYLGKSYKDAWMYADHFVPQLKHCSRLRNVNKHTLKAGQGAPGMGHWLYTLPTAPFSKVAKGPFKRGLQHRLAWLHLERDKAPPDHIGRRVAWRARRARETRRNRLRNFLVEYTKTTGAIATSEQAMPLPRDSQPAAWEARAVRTADIHISEPNGTDFGWMSGWHGQT